MKNPPSNNVSNGEEEICVKNNFAKRRKKSEDDILDYRYICLHDFPLFLEHERAFIICEINETNLAAQLSVLPI